MIKNMLSIVLLRHINQSTLKWNNALRRNLSYNSENNLYGKSVLEFSNDVREAKCFGKPIVALESTIITHGMPYPVNLKTALSVEDIIRDEGAVPATIALMNGKIKIGLSKAELNTLAEMAKKNNNTVIKTSRRDIAYVLSQNLYGGTTVSASLLAARLAEIDVFVTGGIGGVHRNVEDTLDISADLTDLGRTKIAVISAGIKSILDIGKSLEYLETQGVFVATFGTKNTFPSFFSQDSGYKSPYCVSSAQQAAEIINRQNMLKLESGCLFAVPIPSEYSLCGMEIERTIKEALKLAELKGISGKGITPFLLEEINKLTKGESLKANVALIKNNALIGARIAVELNKIQNNEKQSFFPVKKANYNNNEKQSVIIGGINIDLTTVLDCHDFQQNGATYPGRVKQNFGGVARNLADCLSLLGGRTFLISAIGNDFFGTIVEEHSKSRNLSLAGVSKLDNYPTATYSGFCLKNGEVLYGIGDFDIHSTLDANTVSKYEAEIGGASLVFLDANIPVETIRYVCKLCVKKRIPIWYEPTDIMIADKIVGNCTEVVDFMTPNIEELKVIHKAVVKKNYDEMSVLNYFDNDRVNLALNLSLDLMHKFRNILTTMGKDGMLIVTRNDKSNEKTATYFSVGEFNNIQNVLGAGDCLAATFAHFFINEKHSMEEALKLGLYASRLSLSSTEAVPISVKRLNDIKDDIDFKKFIKSVTCKVIKL